MAEPFIWKGDELATIGDLTRAIDALKTETEAQEFIAAYRAVSEHADSNAGYITGYLEPTRAEERRRWMETPHPVFGMMSPTPFAAIEAGKRWAMGEMNS